MSREEYLNKKRLAERARYRRIKSDPIKYAEYVEKYKRKYQSQKRRGLVKGVKDMTQEETIEARRMWRQRAAAYRQRNSYKLSDKNDTGLPGPAVTENVADPGSVSDDDVIEVVRDEAPIEILSDGEEMEIQKSKHVDMFRFNETFNFTTPQALEKTTEENTYRDQVDPLENSFIDIENTFTQSEPDEITKMPIIPCTTPLEDGLKTGEKSNHDSSGENCFINVTDVVNSLDNDAEKLKQTVQEELESKGDLELNIDVTTVSKDITSPIDTMAIDNKLEE